MLEVPIEKYVIETRSVGTQATLGHAREILDGTSSEILPVTDDRGRTVGVISRSDLFRASRDSSPPEPRASRPSEAQVGALMTEGPVVVAPSTSVGQAAALMVDKHIHHVLVEDGHRVIGVFGVLEVMRAIVDAQVEIPLSAIMTRPVTTVDATLPASEAVQLLDQKGVSALAVIEAGAPAGVFTKRDAIGVTEGATARVRDVIGPRSATLPASTPAYVAAAKALDQGMPHVLVTGDNAALEGAAMLVGIVTGIDLAGAAVIARG